MAISGRLVMSLVILGMFVGMVAMATAYPPDSRFLPFVVGLPAIVLAGIQVAAEIVAVLRARAQAPEAPAARPPAGPSRTVRELIIFGWFLGFVAAILLLGFLVAAPLSVLAFLRLQQREPWALSLALASGAWLLVYFVFQRLLRMVLFEGFLLDWLGI